MSDHSGIPAVGSRWYGWGHHFEVVALTKRDGEPAVRCAYAHRKGSFTVMIRLLLRHAQEVKT